MAGLMVMNQERRADPYENAKRWMKENANVVAGWKSGTKSE
jgi:glycine betaine/proline transport system substrate-binding protein